MSVLERCRDLPIRTFAPGDTILAEGTRSGVLYVLVSGTIDISAYRDRATAVMPKPFDPGDFVAAAHRYALG